VRFSKRKHAAKSAISAVGLESLSILMLGFGPAFQVYVELSGPLRWLYLFTLTLCSAAKGEEFWSHGPAVRQYSLSLPQMIPLKTLEVS
jgi:hypothetical protein